MWTRRGPRRGQGAEVTQHHESVPKPVGFFILITARERLGWKLCQSWFSPFAINQNMCFLLTRTGACICLVLLQGVSSLRDDDGCA